MDSSEKLKMILFYIIRNSIVFSGGTKMMKEEDKNCIAYECMLDIINNKNEEINFEMLEEVYLKAKRKHEKKLMA